MPESREFKWEKDSKSAQDVHILTFHLEKPLPITKKRGTLFYFPL